MYRVVQILAPALSTDPGALTKRRGWYERSLTLRDLSPSDPVVSVFAVEGLGRSVSGSMSGLGRAHRQRDANQAGVASALAGPYLGFPVNAHGGPSHISVGPVETAGIPWVGGARSPVAFSCVE